MYYMCKAYIDLVKDMKPVITKYEDGTNHYKLMDWQKWKKILDDLAKLNPICENIKNLYNIIPVVYRNDNVFELTKREYDDFMIAKNRLIIAMETIISTYELINTKKCVNINAGFDIKLPQFDDIGEFSHCLEDLDFFFKQCPYMKCQEEDIKYGSVDVGSTWLTFLITGTTIGNILLTNLSKIIDKAVKIKSHIVTVKAQEEILRSMEQKNEIMEDMIELYHKTNKALIGTYVNELENEIGKLDNGEDKDKVGKSLEKLAYWMDKGMQIYSAIDAPAEVKDLFPEQAEASFLTDDIQKLLTMKKNVDEV